MFCIVTGFVLGRSYLLHILGEKHKVSGGTTSTAHMAMECMHNSEKISVAVSGIIIYQSEIPWGQGHLCLLQTPGLGDPHSITVGSKTKSYTAYMAVGWIQNSKRRVDQGRTTRNSVTWKDTLELVLPRTRWRTLR